jgi:hypothetical protein
MRIGKPKEVTIVAEPDEPVIAEPIPQGEPIATPIPVEIPERESVERGGQ